MPRTSMEELMIKDGGLAASLTRADVPYDLDDDAAVEWRRIINSMPADHFIPANHHMLIMLCRHLVEARRISGIIRSYCKSKDRRDVKVYLALVKQQTVEHMMIAKLSRSMRITHQSTYNKTAVNLRKIATQSIDMPQDDVSW